MNFASFYLFFLQNLMIMFSSIIWEQSKEHFMFKQKNIWLCTKDDLCNKFD